MRATTLQVTHRRLAMVGAFVPLFIVTPLALGGTTLGLGPQWIAAIMLGCALVRPALMLLRAPGPGAFDPINVGFIGYAAWYLVAAVQGGLSFFGFNVAEEGAQLRALATVAIGSAATTIVALMGARVAPPPFVQRWSSHMERGRTGWVVVAGVMFLSQVLVSSGGSITFILSVFRQLFVHGTMADVLVRRDLGNENVILLSLSGLSVLVGMFAARRVLVAGDRWRWLLLGAVGFVFAYRFFLGRRGIFWVHLASFIAPFIIELLRRRRRLFLAGLVVLIPLALLVNQYSVMQRRSLMSSTLTREQAVQGLAEAEFQGHDQFSPLVFMNEYGVEVFEQEYGGLTVFPLAVFPVPRAIWPGKPVGIGVKFTDYIFSGRGGASSTFGHLGEFGVDFGFPLGALVGGAFMGLWLVLLTSIYRADRFGAWILYGFFASVTFFAFRGIPTFQHAILVAGFLVMVDVAERLRPVRRSMSPVARRGSYRQ